VGGPDVLVQVGPRLEALEAIGTTVRPILAVTVAAVLGKVGTVTEGLGPML
jgi:hypothetical protein